MVDSESLDSIEKFVRKHHVMTLATVGSDGQPWCAHLFYAWMADERCFVFTTGDETRHGAQMIACPRVAAAIALETRIVGRVQGLQIEGEVKRVECNTSGEEAALAAAARRAYLRRFPYAAAMPGLELWVLSPSLMKLSDNTLGFGKKLIWQKPPITKDLVIGGLIEN
ncbi:MAG: pyridoxamine 5'-phosphate oxidase family protein [Alistipes sp.]|jgi:uncharacterized protein YhbP (UPF0306 family)|nr:pyridoxamine 5'-phosphate oxidase family protein [Alistipes sp.]